MAIIVPIDMPEDCDGCPFRTQYIEHVVNVHEGTYKHIARCRFQPEEVEDGYKDMKWFMHNRFKWCPLKDA